MSSLTKEREFIIIKVACSNEREGSIDVKNSGKPRTGGFY